MREAIKVISGEADLWVATGKQADQTAVIKVFRWGLHPKPELQAKLSKVSRAQVVEVYGQGVLPDGRHYEILEHIRHGTLADLGKAAMAPARVKAVLKELADAVEALHEAGILHRDLKPSNVLVRTVEPLDLVLTDFGISSLTDLSLHATSVHRTAAYSAPEAMTGVVSRASDWWSVGVMVLELLRGAHAFAGLDERAVNFQLVTRGIEVPADLAPDWALLVKGLLTRDHVKRWGAEQVRAWLRGKRNLTVHYASAASTVIGQKPYRFLGCEYSDAASLAVALVEKWKEGVKHWGRGFVLQWIEKQLEDQDLATQLHDMQDDAGLKTPELQLAAAALAMNRELPLTYKGELVTPDWLGSNWETGHEVLDSRLPWWLNKMRKEIWLKEALKRCKEGMSYLHKVGFPVDEDSAERLLASGNQTVIDDLVAERRRKYAAGKKAKLTALLRKRTLEFNEAVALIVVRESELVTAKQLLVEESLTWLKKHRVKCKRDEAINMAKRCKEGMSYLHTVGDLMDNKLALKMLASGNRAVVDDLVSERRRKYVAGRKEILTTLLRKEHLEFQEAVALVVVSENEFFTAEQLLVEESLAWLDKQGVKYHRDDAIFLILARDWEILTPKWEARRSRFWLGKSPLLEKALASTKPDYLEAVLGATAEESSFWPDAFAKGEAYAEGNGVALNKAEAVRWWRLAAEQGNVYAQFNLGLCYNDGVGLSQDMVEAVRWYRLAAEQGHAGAQSSLGISYANGYGVAQNMVDAVRWLRLAAEQGITGAQFMLGVCYSHGDGVAKNQAEAVRWYRSATERGHAAARSALEGILHHG